MYIVSEHCDLAELSNQLWIAHEFLVSLGSKIRRRRISRSDCWKMECLRPLSFDIFS